VLTKQLFETTLYGEGQNAALVVVSVPTDRLTTIVPASSPADVMQALLLRPVAEVPSAYLGDALASILATTSADEAARWLSEPPKPAPVKLGPDLEQMLVNEGFDRSVARGYARSVPGREVPSTWARSTPRRKERRKISKDEPRTEELREFGRDIAKGAVVPFQRSPIDLYAIDNLVELGDAARTFVVTVRSNPLALVWVPGGFLLCSALRGTGRGLSAGLQYRLLRLFGLPDDIIKDQMSRRRRG